MIYFTNIKQYVESVKSVFANSLLAIPMTWRPCHKELLAGIIGRNVCDLAHSVHNHWSGSPRDALNTFLFTPSSSSGFI